MLARVGGRYLVPSKGAALAGAIQIGSARGAMLVLTTGRRAGGEARRGGDGARPQGSAENGGVPGEVPGTADCYGHCWNIGNTCLEKQYGSGFTKWVSLTRQCGQVTECE